MGKDDKGSVPMINARGLKAMFRNKRRLFNSKFPAIGSPDSIPQPFLQMPGMSNRYVVRAFRANSADFSSAE